MLLLMTAETLKEKEVWFIVNGVPIRYGHREHAFILRLNCRNYPLGYKEFGSTDLVKRPFQGVNEVGRCETNDFVNGSPQRKAQYCCPILPSKCRLHANEYWKRCKTCFGVFQRVLGDLEFCRTFLWGTYSHEYIVKEISHTMDHFKGRGGVKEDTLWPLPGFCLPLEAIQQLWTAFTE